jgi:hypothetical protein
MFGEANRFGLYGTELREAHNHIMMMTRLWVMLALCAIAYPCGSHDASGSTLVGPTPAPVACSAPEYHQFDFWIGDWDASNVDVPTTLEARLRVDRILEGCVLREDYQDVHGHKGQSFSIYDASREMWHQTWVTNRGELLLLDGTFQDGEIVLSGHDIENGRPTEIRGTWKSENGGVRETAVRSLDNGKTWQPWFDLILRPHGS